MRTLALLLLLAVPLGARAFEIAPVPDWVVPVAPDLDHRPAEEEARGGVAWLLVDHQLDAASSASARHGHFAKRIVAAEGIEHASELRFGWDPSHEQLKLHFVRIHRAGAAIDALSREKIRVFQPEADLDRRMFNGALEAVAVLEDVRAGDVIEWAYTVEGSNPVFAGQAGWSVDLGLAVPVRHLAWRLRWPAGRPLRHRAHRTSLEPSVEEDGGIRRYLWELRDVPAILEDDALPSWFDPYPWVQLSSASSWREIADWALRLYEARGTTSPALDERVEAIRAAHDGDEARLLEALRFVQDEVRYLGMELGPHSHRPHAPPLVFERRFGDCKDKSLLLVTILERLGIEAWPALVNTRVGRGLDDWLPSAYAFDHVIVEARLGGRSVWVDPTVSFERGPLAERSPPPFERALPIREGVDALSILPAASAPEPTMVVEERFRVEDYASPAELEVVTTYARWEADRFRRRVALTPLAELARGWLNYYAGRDAGIEAIGAPSIEDDPERNVLVVRERYRIPDFFSDGRRDFYAATIAERLGRPRIHRRTMPLALEHPLHVRHRTRVELPRAPSIEPDRETIEDGALRFEARSWLKKSALHLEYRLQTVTGEVPPEQVRRHLETLDRVEDALGYHVTAPDTAAPRDDEWIAAAVVLAIYGWLGVVAMGGVGLVLLLARERPGGVASRPFLADDAARVREALAALRCGCGGRYAEAGHARHDHAGRVVTEIALRCGLCGTPRSFFAAPRDGRARG